MAIRQRLQQRMPQPKYRDGYPDLLFLGFRERFMHINAVFVNAKMQSAMGVADASIQLKKGQAATFHFFTYNGLREEVCRRVRNNLKTDFLEEVFDQWPEGRVPGHLLWRIGDE